MLTIYKASAGSGKTYTLAFEYIKSLLGVKEEGRDAYRLNSARYSPTGRRQRNRHKGILAITFTNKATDEMKARIVGKLNALACDGPGADYASTLTALFGCSQAELAAEAATALREMLNDYRHFNVSTIDSFFQMVLRTFAREIDRQGDYEIELNDAYAVAAGVGMLFDDLNLGEAPGEERIKNWISEFMRSRIARGQSFNVFDRSSRLAGEVVSYVRRMCGEDFKLHARDTIDYLADPSRLKRYREAIAAARKASVEAMQRTAALALCGLDALPEGRATANSTFLGMLEQAAAGAVPVADRFAVGDDRRALTFKAILAGDERKAYTIGKLPKVKRQTVFPDAALTESLFAAARAMQQAYVDTVMCDMLADATRSLEFLGLAWSYVDDFRRQNNLVLMSDTNDLLRRIINGAEAPFIYERIGMELHTFLIDEFQDTSVMQWDNLRPLVDNSIDEADSLIIGDEKQAIYRFRNSDSSLLHHVVATRDFPAKHITRGSAPADNTNHRSAHGLVRFNNALFSRLATTLGVTGYENVCQHLFGKFDSLGSYVCLRPLESLVEPADDGRKPRAADLRDASIEAMAADILRQHEAGYAWADIAVLVRYRKEAPLVVSALMGRHPEIPLLSDEGLRLDSSAAVRLIVSVLKFVDSSYTHADDHGSDREYATFGDILLMLSRFEFAAGRTGELNRALDDALNGADNADIDTHVAAVRAARAANLPALVEVIISHNVPPAQREREFAYIAAFQDTVLDYCSTRNPSVHAFLDWWAANSPRLTIGASATLDAVTVMTIHKAKGLEWDCVHIPFAAWDINTKDDTVWVDTASLPLADEAHRPPVLAMTLNKAWPLMGGPFAGEYARNKALQTADNLNLTYVAFTRPARELIVHYDESRNVGRLLADALAQPHATDDGALGLCLPGGQADGAYVFGAPTAPAHKAAKALDICPTPAYMVNFRDDTRELTTVADITNAEPDLCIGNEAPTREAAPAIVRTQEEASLKLAADRGNALHDILARIATPADLDAAVGAVAARYGLDDATAEEYAATLREAFHSAGKRVLQWFGPGLRILAEQTIYDADRRESFRPDRIVFHPDGSVDIVDYKFTTEPHDSHRTQVQGYKNMLRAMGHTRLRGYLWYPELRRILEV